jgi:hypothetical protein
MLVYIKKLIDDAINEVSLAVEENNFTTEILKLVGTEESALTISTTSVTLDFDSDTVKLTDESNPPKSTPVIFMELNTRDSTLSSVQGSIINGESEFDIIILVSKHNRKFAEYKTEVLSLVDFILELFKQDTSKRIKIGKITFSDWQYNGIIASSAIIPITLPIGNYNYAIN